MLRFRENPKAPDINALTRHYLWRGLSKLPDALTDYSSERMATIKLERLLSELRTLAAFGAYKTGVRRPTLSAQDIAAREWFVGRMREAGLDAEIDGIADTIPCDLSPVSPGARGCP